MRKREGGRLEAKNSLSRAQEFLDAAKRELEFSLNNAATGNAAVSAVNSCDAICLAELGRRSASINHEDAAELLAQSIPVGRKAHSTFRRIIPLKNKAQYAANDRVTHAQARNAVRWAEKMLEFAREAVGEA